MTLNPRSKSPTARLLSPAPWCALALALSAAASPAVVLYDPALGSLPAAQGWLSTGIGSISQGVSGGIYSLDTTAFAATQWGNAQTLSATPLDTQVGFDLNFRLRVLSEDHGSNVNRAGFSVLFTGADPTHSLELAFWSDRAWAYHYDANLGSPFVQGVGAALDTTAWIDYALQVRSQQFTLWAGSTLLMRGPLENYTAQGAPYSGANFLFIGDDTSSARASVQLGAVTLAAVPEPGSALLMLAGGLLVAWRRSRRSGAGIEPARPVLA